MNQNIKDLKDQVLTYQTRLDLALQQIKTDLEGFKNKAIGIHIDLSSGDIVNSLSFTSESYDAHVKAKKEDLKNFKNPIEVLILHADKEGYDIMTFKELKPLIVKE